MLTVKVKVETEIEKKLDLPKLYSEDFYCLGVGTLDCSGLNCSNCLFYIKNYKTLLGQQKGGDN